MNNQIKMLLSKYKYIYVLKIISLILSSIIFLFLYWFSNKSNDLQWDIVFILDVSHSMNISDVSSGLKSTSRLDSSKKIIQDLMNKHQENKFWLILFSQKSNYFIPPTYDKNTFDTYLTKLNTNALPAWGTNIYQWLKNFIDNSQEGTLGIIISDLGESTDLEKQREEIYKLKEQYINKKQKLIILWVWSEEWWLAKLPSWEILSNNKQWRNDQFWEFLKSEFNWNYITYQSKLNQNINLSSNNSYNLNEKNKKLLEILAALLWILSI